MGFAWQMVDGQSHYGMTELLAGSTAKVEFVVLAALLPFLLPITLTLFQVSPLFFASGLHGMFCHTDMCHPPARQRICWLTFLAPYHHRARALRGAYYHHMMVSHLLCCVMPHCLGSVLSACAGLQSVSLLCHAMLHCWTGWFGFACHPSSAARHTQPFKTISHPITHFCRLISGCCWFGGMAVCWRWFFWLRCV